MYFIPVKLAIRPLRRQLVLPRVRAQPWTGETDGWFAGQVLVSAWHRGSRRSCWRRPLVTTHGKNEGDWCCSTEAQTADVLLDLSKGPVRFRFRFNTPGQKWDGNGSGQVFAFCNHHLQAMLSRGLQGPATACWRMLLYGMDWGFLLLLQKAATKCRAKSKGTG
jgi:hypothetical protein